MKVVIITDEDNYVTNFYYSNDEGVNIDITEYDTKHINCYKFINNVLLLDTDKYEQALEEDERKARQLEIELEVLELKKELADTDYQIIKCYEYQLAGLDLPYDIDELHTTRQALRDRINELEN